MAELFIPRNVRRFKSIRHFKTPSGSHVIVLPTCSVPLGHLVESNWGKQQRRSNVGASRRVRYVDHLANGKQVRDNEDAPTALYVKSPEREYVIGPKKYAVDSRRGGDPFIWSREDQTGKSIRIKPGDIRIEKQATWEARILLGLAATGIRAEIQQAVVIHKNGAREVITKGILSGGKVNRGIRADEDSFLKLGERVDSAGFDTADFEDHNLVEEETGRLNVIDVNRWLWPPYTDHYRTRLLEAVHEAVQKESWLARLTRLNKPRVGTLQTAVKMKIRRGLQKLRMWKDRLSRITR